uniref:Uncharacterized protein n=1 Tax=Peronospora matthiolae TaxID=2874970 RepID=A0AAV1U101_9STRA
MGCLVVWKPPRAIYDDNTVALLLAFSFCSLKTSGVTAGHSRKGPWTKSEIRFLCALPPDGGAALALGAI